MQISSFPDSQRGMSVLVWRLSSSAVLWIIVGRWEYRMLDMPPILSTTVLSSLSSLSSPLSWLVSCSAGSLPARVLARDHSPSCPSSLSLSLSLSLSSASHAKLSQSLPAHHLSNFIKIFYSQSSFPNYVLSPAENYLIWLIWVDHFLPPEVEFCLLIYLKFNFCLADRDWPRRESK